MLLIHDFLSSSLGGCTHFTDEETEALEGEVICPRSHKPDYRASAFLPVIPPLDTGKRQSKVSGQPIMGMADVWEEA